MIDLPKHHLYRRTGNSYLDHLFGIVDRYDSHLVVVGSFRGDRTPEENLLDARDRALSADLPFILPFNETHVLIGLRASDRTLPTARTFARHLAVSAGQPGHLEIDLKNRRAHLINTDSSLSPLPYPAAPGFTVYHFDVWANRLVPEWETQGAFDLSMSYVQMKDAQVTDSQGCSSAPG
jgi:hypothetical protein